MFWEYIIGQQPQEWARHIARYPNFKSDREFVALQTADLLAWHIRREADGSYPAEYVGILDAICGLGRSFSLVIERDMLAKWGEGMKCIPGTELVTSKRDWNAVVAQMLDQGGVPLTG